METVQTIVVENKVYRPIIDDTLTADDKRVAREELFETTENKEPAMRSLMTMLAEDDEFTSWTDDFYLLKFLRARKFNCERTLKNIQDHYKFRKQHPEFFPSPSLLEKVLRTGIFNFLPHRDHKGRAIYVIKANLWNPDAISYVDCVAAGYLVAEAVLNPVTQINGIVGIWDFKGFSMKQFITFCSSRHVFLMLSLAQDLFPARYKVAYCVNTMSLVSATWRLFKPLLKEKFRERVKFIGYDMQNLHQYFDRSILPVEYGGPMQTPDPNEMAKRVLDLEECVKYDRNFGYLKD